MCSKITFTIQACRTCPIYKTIALYFSAKLISLANVYVENVHNHCSNRITNIITYIGAYTLIFYTFTVCVIESQEKLLHHN